MLDILMAVITQSLTFFPLALGISISYYLLRATDMTLDASFVIGAAVFARLVTAGLSPTVSALIALSGGALAGMLCAFIQRGGRVDPLLAGVLATFLLSSLSLMIMGKPNINLLTQPTLLSFAFAKSDAHGWAWIAFLVSTLSLLVMALLSSRLGLTLRGLGDNPRLLTRLGKNIEHYRLGGFALTNLLAAASGCLTAQTVGYADIGMGFGMTLTGIGAIILGQQLLQRVSKQNYLRIKAEYLACLVGVTLYFFFLNMLLRLDLNPIYLKMMLGLLLILFLRAAIKQPLLGARA